MSKKIDVEGHSDLSDRARQPPDVDRQADETDCGECVKCEHRQFEGPDVPLRARQTISESDRE
jgi:hypothetical protein